MTDEKEKSSYSTVHPAAVNQVKRIEQLKAGVEAARKTPTPSEVVGSPAWHKKAVEKNKASISPKVY